MENLDRNQLISKLETLEQRSKIRCNMNDILNQMKKEDLYGYIICVTPGDSREIAQFPLNKELLKFVLSSCSEELKRLNEKEAERIIKEIIEE